MGLCLCFLLLLLISGSAPRCPRLVAGPQEVVAPEGTCVSIPCHYDLCEAGRGAQVKNLTWIHLPVFDNASQQFWGREVGKGLGVPGAADGPCDLVLPRVGPGDAGAYGLRLEVARATRRTRWMHPVTLNVTAAHPAPHLWPTPSTLPGGHRVTFGCWVPRPCPKDPLTLSWEGPLAQALGSDWSPWTPPATVTPHPVLGTLLVAELLWHHDGTTLNCILKGGRGETLARASRLLEVHYAPRDVEVEVSPSSPLHEGQEVTLQCRARANPPATLTWLRAGQVLPRGSAHLLLWPIRAEDAGTYHCRATNGLGATDSGPAHIDVLYAPRDVEVEVSPSSPLHEGQEVTLQCRARANPPATLTWLRGGQVLPRGSAHLLLWPIRAEDAGTYRCRAANELGAGESGPAHIDVLYPPRGATVITLSPLPALPGTRVTLRCNLGPARPPPTVWWWREGAGTPGGTLGDTLGDTLSFPATPGAAGAYGCEGRNPAGITRSPKLAVVIWYPPQSVELLQSPGGPVVVGKGPVRLQCRAGVAQPPHVTVTWFKDGRALPEPSPTLVLPGPAPTDAARYLCEARNEAGVARSPLLTLDVHFPPRGVSLEPGPGREVTEGTDLTLRCEADARPPPHTFEWFREGQSLGATPGGLRVLREVGTPDSGRYRCRVTNAIASADSADVTVTVRYSSSTVLRRTFVGLSVGLSLLLALGALGHHLRHRKPRAVAADEEPVVEPSRTFFLCNKKPRTPRAPGDVGDSSQVSPPPSSVPRLRGDTVVYTVLKRSDGTAKAPEGPDYENVPGIDVPPREGDGEGTLVYAALALPCPGPPRRDSGDLGDSVEYVALRR